MGKKLTRKSAKLRAISLNKEKKDRMLYADSLLEKWGVHYRDTLMPLVNNEIHEPPALAEFDSDIEDQITEEVINMLSTQNREVAIGYWVEGLKPIQIAEQMALDKDQVRLMLAFVREQVANKALS